MNVPGVDGSGFGMRHVGYTFYKKDAGQEFSRWYFDLIWNFEGNKSDAIDGGSRQMIATGLQFLKDDYEVVGEFALAHGGDVGSLWGLTVQGSYWVADDLVKLVGRYHYAGAGDATLVDPDMAAPSDLGAIQVGYGIARPGSDAQGVGLPATVVYADEFHSFYAGVNLHLLEKYSIVHAGAEYSITKNRSDENTSSWMLLTGMRVAF